MAHRVESALGAAKQSLVRHEGERSVVEQVGGLVLDEPFAPRLVFEPSLLVDEPLIETFMVDPTGACSGTGPVAALGGAWAAASWAAMAQDFAGRVLERCRQAGIELVGPTSVTASLTPLDQVIDAAHADDDIYQPEAGVGVAAVVASHLGPRLRRSPLGVSKARPGAPLSIPPTELDALAEDADAVQQVDADRIVIFPLFGQLHGGPSDLTQAFFQEPSGDRSSSVDRLRHLLVLRSGTVPSPQD